MQPGEVRPLQVGVVSWALNNGTHTHCVGFGAYTSVAASLNFLEMERAKPPDWRMDGHLSREALVGVSVGSCAAAVGMLGIAWCVFAARRRRAARVAADGPQPCGGASAVSYDAPFGSHAIMGAGSHEKGATATATAIADCGLLAQHMKTRARAAERA